MKYLHKKTIEALNVEKKLKENEERYRNLFEHMSSAVAIYEAVNNGEDFIFKDFNTAAEKIEKISRDLLIGKSVLEIFPAVKDFGIFEVFQRVYRTGKPEYYPVSFYKDNRISGWRDNYIDRLSSGEIVAIYDDVTEHKQSEEALRLSEYKYRSIFENAVEGIFQTTPEGQYISVNPALASMSGYDSPEEMVKNITDIGGQGYVNPEDRLIFKKTLKEQNTIQGFEVQHYRKDRSVIWVSISARSVKDETGKVVYYEGTIEDITSRKQAEGQLRLERRRFAVLSENAPFGMAMIDKNGILIYINPKFKEIFGYDLSDIPDGKTWFRKIYPDTDYKYKVISAWIKDLQEAEPGRQRAEIFTVVCKDGKKKIINFIPVQLETGENIMSCEDITEREEHEEKLQKLTYSMNERLKELNCLYGITNLMQKEDISIEFLLQGIVDIIPPAYQYPDIASARIIIYGNEYRTKNFSETAWNLKSDIIVFKEYAGFIQVCYMEDKSALNEEIFFQEEKTLLATIAERVGKIMERIQAVESLHESEEKFRALLDNAADAILIADMEGIFLEVNKSAEDLLGYTKKELLGMKAAWIHPEEELEKVMHVFQEIATGKSNSCYDTKILRKDGKTVPVDITGTVIEYAGQKVAQGMFRDITERKQAEEKLKQTMEKLRKSLVGTIQAISLTVETKDPYTAGHQRRVSNLARVIAQEMGFENDVVDNIRMAGSIHDIGKMSVPAEILSKPTKLSNIEMGLIKVHPESGYNILKDVELPYPIAEIVLQHHERLDGSGYPQGIKGDQILLEAQIISIADVVEAIASNRPYRPAKGIDAALEEIEMNKGILYNTEAVDVCLRLFREKGFCFE